MRRDVKDIVGTLMHVLNGGDLSPEQLADVGFEAEGELQTALNEAYIHLMEFAHDSAERPVDPELVQRTRSSLQQSLERIVTICEREADLGARTADRVSSWPPAIQSGSRPSGAGSGG